MKTLRSDRPCKRILVATDYYAPHWTGIVKSFVNMIEALSADLDFTVVTVKYAPDLAAEEHIGNVHVFREPYWFQLSRACYSIAVLRRFWLVVKAHDAVVINSPCSNILPFAILTKLARKRLVVFHQGDLILPRKLANWVIERTFDICTLAAMASADQVSSYTRDYADHSRVLRHFHRKFTPALMPVYLEEPGERMPAALRELARRKEGGVLFGFGGRFVEEKGIDVLIRAIPRVLEHLPHAHFAFAGETRISYEDTFERMRVELDSLGSHLSFVGLLQGGELTWFYRLIDFIVIPSRSECLSLVQVEACLCGKPSICSDVPGARDVVKSTGFGLLFQSENPDDLAARLIEAVERRDELLHRWGVLREKFDLGHIKHDTYRLLTGSLPEDA